MRFFGLRKPYETESYFNWFVHHVCWVLGGREITFLYQRLTRGFDDSELWSLDDTIIRFTLPRLKAFRFARGGKGPMGMPMDFIGDVDAYHAMNEADMQRTCDEGYAKWLETLDKMILAMEIYVREDGFPFGDEDVKKYEEGMSLFHKFFNGLWD